MYTAADFKLIRRICPDELNRLLKNLGINPPDFNAKDEFEIYTELDAMIEKKFCAKLQSNSVLEGYTKLLDLGGVAFSLSETRIELLKKILANRDKILKGSTENSAQVSDKPPVAAIVGGIFLLCGVGYFAMSDNPNTIIAILGVVAGIAGIGLEIFNKNKKPEPQPNKLSRQQIESVLPILTQVNKIFDSI